LIAGQIEIQMLADVARLRKDMGDVRKATSDTASAAESAARLIRNVFAGLSLGYLVREFVQTADAMNGVNSRLRLATRSAEEYETAQRDVYRISQANLTPLKETATLYSRLADPVRKLGGDAATTATIVESFATALRISGATTAEASSATLQFSQAMAGGALRGEEFNSVNEAAPRVMQALETALGKTRGELRKMAEQGLLTADVVGNALVSQFLALQAEAQSMPLTVGGSMQQLRNDVGLFVVAVNEATGATTGMAGMVTGVSGLLREFTLVFSAAGTSAANASVGLDLAGIGLAVIGRIIETVVLVGSDVAFVFRAVGIELGGLAAQGAALVRGDFGQVAEIHRQMKIDAEANRAELDRFQTSVAGTTDRMLAQRDALKAGALSASENAAEMGKLMRQGTETAGALRAATAATTKDADEKKRAAAAAKEAAEAQKSMQAAYEAMTKARADGVQAQQAEALAIAEQVLRLQQENEQIGLTREQLQALELSRIDDSIATAEQTLQTAIAIGYYGTELDGIKGQITALRELKTAKEQGWAKEAAIQARDAAQETAAEWAKTVKSVEDGLVDALMRSFESGASFLDAFKNTLVNAFKTLILQPTIRAVMAPIAGGLGSLFGGGAQAAAGGVGGGAGGLLGLLGQGSSMLGTLGSFGATGLMSTLSGVGLGTSLGAAGTLMSSGSIMGGLGMGLGAIAPYALAAGALYSAFKHKPTHHIGSVVGTGANGAQSTMYGDPSGILNNYSAETDAALRALSGGSVGSLNMLSQAFGGGGGFSSEAKFAADGHDASIGSFLLNKGGQRVGAVGSESQFAFYSSDAKTALEAFSGDVVQATRQALTNVGLPQWAKDQFNALASTAGIDEFRALAEQVARTQQGMTALRTSISPLGGIFASVASLSGDALYQLTEFAGGIEAFAAQAAGFVRNYYSADEQAAIQARGIFDSLTGAGLNLAGLNTRDEYRALVESRDVNTEQGRQQLAALLAQAEAFAQLTEYLDANGGTLYSLSQLAPNSDISALLGPGTGGTGTPSIGLDAVVTAVTDSNVQVVDALQRLGETLTGALATVAGNTARSSEYLRDLFEEQQALVT
jgi:tape measure domain-containing protein